MSPVPLPENPPSLRAEEAEILDRPGLPPRVVEAALAELARVNRWLLGHLPVRRVLVPRLLAGPAEQWLLDVGTGSGEVADRVVRWAGEGGCQVRVVGVDRQLTHLLAGRRWGVAQLRVAADARHLPFRDGAFHWSLSTLFFHHFEAPANGVILGEMARVARRGAVVVDLRRSRVAALLGRLLIPLTGAGPITCHDGRVSLGRAWSVAAVARLVEGWPVDELRRRLPFRFSLVLSGREGGPAPPAARRSRPPSAPR
ncbi:MAG TPA: methyltransferase domain-containing protein [Thermoanaerobaculia bacterium]|nr:methyltransferase domain-containing protein [Thermoanaerobaculia bacterium]